MKQPKAILIDLQRIHSTEIYWVVKDGWVGDPDEADVISMKAAIALCKKVNQNGLMPRVAIIPIFNEEIEA